MDDTKIAKLFRIGQHQAVRLPRDCEFAENFVRVRRVAGGILLTPLIRDTEAWFAKLDQIGRGAFLKAKRKQPATPKRRIFK